MSYYTSGMKVRIIANHACHRFEIGEVVTLYAYWPEGHGGIQAVESSRDFPKFWSTSPNPYDGGCVESNDIEPLGAGKKKFAKWLKAHNL